MSFNLIQAPAFVPALSFCRDESRQSRWPRGDLPPPEEKLPVQRGEAPDAGQRRVKNMMRLNEAYGVSPDEILAKAEEHPELLRQLAADSIDVEKAAPFFRGNGGAGIPAEPAMTSQITPAGEAGEGAAQPLLTEATGAAGSGKTEEARQPQHSEARTEAETGSSDEIAAKSYRLEILNELSQVATKSISKSIHDAIRAGYLRGEPPFGVISEIRNRSLANGGVIDYLTSHLPEDDISKVEITPGISERLYTRIQADADADVARALKKKGLYNDQSYSNRRFITVRPEEGLARTVGDAATDGAVPADKDADRGGPGNSSQQGSGGDQSEE